MGTLAMPPTPQLQQEHSHQRRPSNSSLLMLLLGWALVWGCWVWVWVGGSGWVWRVCLVYSHHLSHQQQSALSPSWCSGVVVGIVIAGVAALALTFTGVLVWHRRRRGRPALFTRRNKGPPASSPPNATSSPLPDLDSAGCKTESCEVLSDGGQQSAAGIDSTGSQQRGAAGGVAIGVTAAAGAAAAGGAAMHHGSGQTEHHSLAPTSSRDLLDTGGSGSMVSSLASEMQHALSHAEYNYLVPPQDVQQLKQVCVWVCVLRGGDVWRV